jgi:DNA invertase Pin-like site-specific DNA recombinase
MALIGYARISTTDQELDLQNDALRAAGCTRIFVDRCSGATGDRPGLAEALAFLREGDVLAVWKLDRLGRSMRDLVRTVEDLDGRDVGLRSLTEQLDTQTPGGRLIFHIFGALAQFERDLILERTAAGLAAARDRGRTGGRRPVVTPEKLRRANAHIAAGLSVREAASRVKVGKTALYAALEQGNESPAAAEAKRRG